MATQLSNRQSSAYFLELQRLAREDANLKPWLLADRKLSGRQGGRIDHSIFSAKTEEYHAWRDLRVATPISKTAPRAHF